MEAVCLACCVNKLEIFSPASEAAAMESLACFCSSACAVCSRARFSRSGASSAASAFVFSVSDASFARDVASALAVSSPR